MSGLSGASSDWSHLHADSRWGVMAEDSSPKCWGPADFTCRPSSRPLRPQPSCTGRAKRQDQGGLLQGPTQRRCSGVWLQREEGQVGLRHYGMCEVKWISWTDEGAVVPAGWCLGLRWWCWDLMSSSPCCHCLETNQRGPTSSSPSASCWGQTSAPTSSPSRQPTMPDCSYSSPTTGNITLHNNDPPLCPQFHLIFVMHIKRRHSRHVWGLSTQWYTD